MVEKYYYNEECTLTAIPENCCMFSHWVKKDNPCEIVSYDNPFTFNVHDNTAYEAVFKKKKYNVFVGTNNRPFSCINGQGVYECGDEVSISVSVGQCFNVVWDDYEMNENSSITVINGIKTITYTIDSISEDIYANAIVTLNNAHITAQSCPLIGGVSNIIHFRDAENHNIGKNICDENLRPNDISYDACEHIGSECDTFIEDNLVCGEEITLIATPNDGYVFKGWKRGDCTLCESNTGYLSYDNIYSTVVFGDTDYVACFEETEPIQCVEFCFVPFEIKNDCYLIEVTFNSSTKYIWMKIGEFLKVPYGASLKVYYYYYLQANICENDYCYEIATDGVHKNEYDNTIYYGGSYQHSFVSNGWVCGEDAVGDIKFDTSALGFYYSEISSLTTNVWLSLTEIVKENYHQSDIIQNTLPACNENNEYMGDYYSSGLNVFGCIQN